jgi:lysophospholipase L1-like esterase
MATTQPKAHSDFRKERAQEVADRMAQGPIDAVTLRDSIMEGWPVPLLRAALGAQTVNAGFGAEGTQEVLWRLQTINWRGQRPRYVLLLVGTNDLRFPACAVFEGVSAVIHAIHGTFPGATIIVVSILPRGPNLRTKEQEINTINQELEHAADLLGFEFLDAHDAFLCDHHTPCALYLPGDLHLTPKGYDLLTHLLGDFLAHH